MKLVSALAAMVLLVMTAVPSAQAIVRSTPYGPTPGSQIYFVASLQETDPLAMSSHYCGGVLIAPTWVITAKQCTEGRTLESITVRLGSQYLTHGGELVTVSRVVPHPTRDAALVELSQRVEAAPVVIADEPGLAGTQTKVLGWGQTCPTRGCGGPTLDLREMDSVTEPDSVCSVEKDQICTRYPDDAGPCFGDEGGPLITGDVGRWRLVGLIPSQPPLAGDCALGLSALINVTELRDWIRQHAGG